MEKNNSKKPFEYQEALDLFIQCFDWEAWGPKGVDIQESKNYKKFMKDNNDKGIRGANHFGLKIIRQAVYKDYGNGCRAYQRMQDLLVLEPKMLIDPSVELKWNENYTPIVVNLFEIDDTIAIVKELLQMTNDEIREKFNVKYSFSPETQRILDEQDKETLRKRTEASLRAGQQLGQQIKTQQQANNR